MSHQYPTLDDATLAIVRIYGPLDDAVEVRTKLRHHRTQLPSVIPSLDLIRYSLERLTHAGKIEQKCGRWVGKPDKTFFNNGG